MSEENKPMTEASGSEGFPLPKNISDPEDDMVLVSRKELDKPFNDKMVEIDNVLDFENLKENSVIVLRIGGDAGHKMRMHQAFVRFINSKGDLFKKKKFTVLFLEPEDGLDVLTEEDMDKAGWQKKDPSRIIKPF